jgi:hypothetical protein
MSAHTKGPWNVTNTSPSNALDIAIIFDAQSQVVCSVPKGSSTVAMSERRANARLIAAAPELLEALQLLVGIQDGDSIGMLFSDRLIKARAAIAMATNTKT